MHRQVCAGETLLNLLLAKEHNVPGMGEQCRYKPFPLLFQGYSRLKTKLCGIRPIETPEWNQMKNEKVSSGEQTANCV